MIEMTHTTMAESDSNEISLVVILIPNVQHESTAAAQQTTAELSN